MSTASRAPSTASTHLSATPAAHYPIASTSTSAYTASNAAYPGSDAAYVASGTAIDSTWDAVDSGSEDEGNDTQEYVLAMHDFAPQQQNVTCLSFRAGQVIHVINRDTSGWWDGELDGRRGWFPSNYVSSEVGLLTEEELPSAKVSYFRVSCSVSLGSTRGRVILREREATGAAQSLNLDDA